MKLSKHSPNEKKPRYLCTDIQFPDRLVSIYAGNYVAEALSMISGLDAYKGVKILDLLQAVYIQGQKDGAKKVFDGIENVKALVPHENPGRPKKKRKQ